MPTFSEMQLGSKTIAGCNTSYISSKFCNQELGAYKSTKGKSNINFFNTLFSC